MRSAAISSNASSSVCDVGGRQRAGVAGGAQPLDRRCARHAGRHPGPSCQVDDRDHAPVLEVEAAAVLAAVLDDEPAQEAGGRPVRQREAREHPQQRRVAARRAGRCPRPACRCARPTPDGCRRAPRRGSAPSPASGRRSSCARRPARSSPSARTPALDAHAAVRVGSHPARLEIADHLGGERLQRRADGASSCVAEPHDRASRCPTRAPPRAAPGCRARATQTNRPAAAPHRPRARAPGG